MRIQQLSKLLIAAAPAAFRRALRTKDQNDAFLNAARNVAGRSDPAGAKN
jgi:hypothetical protein